ncbi:DUF2179 domain-containing protein [Phosphitispora sp. TUW77]|uniref:DUF2179 domain-containing protein n=1 Tax=Phosphitispora sp. TUW77 TaxID=3152361 RepID=UPI003AB2EB8C
MELLTPTIGIYLFIFFARVFDMTLDVLRILMLMRDRRVLAAFIGFCEVTVFVIALNQVLTGGLNDIGKVIAYAGGFATGNYFGSLIEHRLAIGYVSLQIFPQHCQCSLIAEGLRNRGFGVTKVEGEGRQGKRTILFASLKRKDLKLAVKILDEISPDVFFTVSDAKNIHGGTFPMKRKGY